MVCQMLVRVVLDIELVMLLVVLLLVVICMAMLV